ncbi:MAG: phosphatase PAP2 family protein [Cryobacterium sp.]|nr:phosphatase PAP2 family protein [Oligoflexia bacterium]
MLTPIHKRDLAASAWMRENQIDLATIFLKCLTATAYAGTWGAVVLGIFALNYYGVLPEWNRLLERTLRAMVAPGFAWVVIMTMKRLWPRERPFTQFENPENRNAPSRPSGKVGPRTNDSFPSGHAASSFAFFAASLFVLGAKVPTGFLIGVGLWASLVSFSRFYLGVHYLSDVLVGIVVGYSLGAAVGFFFR